MFFTGKYYFIKREDVVCAYKTVYERPIVAEGSPGEGPYEGFKIVFETGV